MKSPMALIVTLILFISTLLSASFAVGSTHRKIYIRFVQFVNSEQQVLSDKILDDNIALTNQVFRPVGLEFERIGAYVVTGSEFTELGDNVIYRWPANPASSPLIYPYSSDCPSFVPPSNSDRQETRFYAAMRAATYCADPKEILVFINQGGSNGGQYPWYSRLIGMPSYHMRDDFGLFAHEVGHYLGLPHTKPSTAAYSLDYGIARLKDVYIISPTGKEIDIDPKAKRYFEPFEHLFNPETGQKAPLSLFWDLVYKPGNPNLTFTSQKAAAVHEKDLQPIEQVHNAVFCTRNDPNCPGMPNSQMGADSLFRLRMTIGAGCTGELNFNAKCDYPETWYSFDPRLAAFSAVSSDPRKVSVNLMSYNYTTIAELEIANSDWDKAAKPVIDVRILSPSQITQINRVLKYDKVDNMFFPNANAKGQRPSLVSSTARRAPVLDFRSTIGLTVMDSNGYTGTVKADTSTVATIYTPGEANEDVVDILFYDSGNGHREKRDRSTLSGEQICTKGLCAGEFVKDANGYRGYIDRLYSNGKAIVMFANSKYGKLPKTRDVSTLKRAFSWTGNTDSNGTGQDGVGLYVNDLVIDKNGYGGQIDAVQGNWARVMFYDSRYAHLEWRNTKDLIKGVYSAAGFTAGTRFSDSGCSGTIMRIYSNNQLLIRCDDDSFGHDELHSGRKSNLPWLQ